MIQFQHDDPFHRMSTSSPDAPLLVFNSYSRKDQKWLELLQAHLAPLEREGTIRLWVDKGKIESGDRYNDEITTAIDTCGAAILLISPHFQNSNFIQEKELPRLLRRADIKEIKLYWLQVSDCHLADKLAKTYHSANNSQQALDAMSEAQVNKVLANLARDLEKHAVQAKAARLAAARAEEARRAREAAEEKQLAERAERDAAKEKQRVEQEAVQRAEQQAAKEKKRAEQEAAEEKQHAKREAARGTQEERSQKKIAPLVIVRQFCQARPITNRSSASGLDPNKVQRRRI